MAIFNPIAQKEQQEGILSLIMAIYQKCQSAGEARRERETGPVLVVCVLCVLCERSKCGSGQPPNYER